ncbi:MAG: mechanosensitive ion channel domain-containing protein [Thermoanaerobaculia bacterium]
MTTKRIARGSVGITALALILVLSAATLGTAQDPGPPPPPTPTPQPTPIAASDIPARAAEAAEAARDALAAAAPDARVQDIQQKFTAEQDRITELSKDTERQLKTPGPVSMIKETEKSSERTRDRLDRWLADLASRSSALDGTLDDLGDRIALWQLTRKQGPGEAGGSLPEAVTKQISDTIKTLRDAEKQVRDARDATLDLQAEIAQQKTAVETMIDSQQKQISTGTIGVLQVDSPPLWKAFGEEFDPADAWRQFLSLQQQHWQSLKRYVVEQGAGLGKWVLLFPILVYLSVAMHRKTEVWVRQDKSLSRAERVLSRPIAVALVVTATLSWLANAQAPGVWTDTIALVLVLATLRLLPQLLPGSLKPVPILLLVLFLLRWTVVVAPEGFLIHRLALLALASGGAAICLWILRVLKSDDCGFTERWLRTAVHGGRAALALFVIGGLADLVGSVDFSELVLAGTARAMMAVVALWVVSATLRAMVRVLLLTKRARVMGIAPDHSETVRITMFRAIDFTTVAAWIMVTLRSLLLLDPVRATLLKALRWEFAIGNISIDPGDLLIFGFVIWVSFKIATFVEFLLNVDLLPKVDLPRGVPETISRLTRYVVIVVGAVVASVAAGFDISKITIVIGALGVGIGFGLQNIVNNFVSGLILLFERPIRVGDAVDLNNDGGKVEKIGMRASIVSTWDGAEIIVPNADLISNNVVNWTLNHDRRRMRIPVGVAYGTDPEKAAELIVGVATANKDVDTHPEPACLFVGLGDSSLDFELRAWTAESRFTRVASDLRFAIVRTLDEAGIEIPFPQRDVHVRNDDATAIPQVDGGTESKTAPLDDGDSQNDDGATEG